MSSFPVKPHLFFKLAGPAKTIPHQQSEVTSILKSLGGTRLRIARNDKEGEELWDIRKNLVFSLVNAFPGTEVISTDVCVPISRLPAIMEQYKIDEENINRTIPEGPKLQSLIIGHVGDGNFHSLMYTLISPK